FASGSSVSHWDVSLTPNALMEPAINNDLHDNPDLTPFHFRDIGWFPPATLSLAASPSPAPCQDSVVLTASTSPVCEGAGTVEFLDGPTVIGTGSFTDNTNATFKTLFSTGPHSLTARYQCYTCPSPVTSVELPFGVGCPTATLLSLFRATPVRGAIELRWQF